MEEQRALITLKAMLQKRGFKAENFEVIGQALDETKMYSFEGMLIVFSMKSRVSEKDLQAYIEYSKENRYGSGIIIVTYTRPSEATLAALRLYISERENPLVQIFEIRHLQFDISKHRKVPAHRIISDEERTEMMKEFHVKDPSMLPKIDSQDAMARWIGVRPGDVVEVVGMCETSVDNRRYRYCLADVTNG
jgi:DNA-directed RNA polymerase I, II, and III subunit RPABC1